MTEKTIGWVRFFKPVDAWYGLNPDQRQAYYRSYQALIEQAQTKGAKIIGTYRCRGQSRWERFETWEFPDLDVLIEFTSGLEEMDHYLYFEESNTFGQKYQRQYEPSTWVV
jgi:hypothetical protein